MTDFVRVQQDAANFLEMRLAQHRVTSRVAVHRRAFRSVLWLRAPAPLPHRPNPGFPFGEDVRAIDPGKIDVLVVYARPWDRPWTVLQWPLLMAIQRKYYDYEPEISGVEIHERLGLVRAARWQRHSQWIEVYVRPELARE